METNLPVFQNIWLADDDKDDCELFVDVIKQILPLTTVTLFANGEILMNKMSTGIKPDILFLDINMPCKDGLDCLVEIRAKREFCRLPIVVFSSSKNPKHIDASYGYGANLYYNKPTSFTDLIAGLGNLLRMNWDDPFTITSDHYINNKFVSYTSLPLKSKD